MNRKELILGSMATSKGARFSPVQVQKLFFLLDRNIPHLIGGQAFRFQPYNYGPFDRAVYDELEALAVEGAVEIVHAPHWKEYRLSAFGQERGEEVLRSLPGQARDYIERVGDYVRRLSFTELVSAIYRAYPDMRANSVFQG